MKHEFNTKSWGLFWLILWAVAIDDDRRQEELRRKRARPSVPGSASAKKNGNASSGSGRPALRRDALSRAGFPGELVT